MNRPRIVTAPLLLVVLLLAGQSSTSADTDYALRFDGTTDQLRLTTTVTMLPAGWQSTKTVSVWINPTGTAVCTGAGPSLCDAIIGDRPRSWGIARGTIGGNDRIWVWNWDGTIDSVGIPYTPGEWIHVALVHGGGVLKAFKNGVPVGSVASGPTQAQAPAILYAGGIISNAVSNWTFEGEIDELQLWGIARTDAEVLTSAYQSLAGNESGLAAYYRMSNGSGLTVTDNTGHGFDGTIVDGGNQVPANGPATWVVSGAGTATPPTPNNAPVADPQSVLTLEDTAVAVSLTGSDADNDPLTFRVVGQPGHGTLSGTAPNLVYTPVPNYYGSDALTFVANDGRTDSDPAVVTFTITAVNDPPVAGNDSATTPIDTALLISVLSNDSDIELDPLAITEVSTPSHGVVAIAGTQVSYTPNAGYTGPDTFTYVVSDGQSTATAQVSVTVRAAGADPGYALRFNGTSNFVRLTNTSTMFPVGWENTKSVEVWVKPTGSYACITPPSPIACDAIVGDRSRWWGISRGLYNNQDRLWVWNSDGNLDTVGIPYTPGEWVHIAMVHSGGVLTAYKNGVLVGSVPSGTTQQPQFGAQPVMQLGGVINNALRNWTFEGELDEVRFWGIARTAAEIVATINQPLTGGELGLAAYYSMSNGSGTILTDDSLHGFTGTLMDGGVDVPPAGPIQWVPSGAFTAPQ